jgi:hypothetical protein
VREERGGRERERRERAKAEEGRREEGRGEMGIPYKVNIYTERTRVQLL